MCDRAAWTVRGRWIVAAALLVLTVSFSAQGQIIFFDDFESYANTAQMNAVGNWGDNLTTGNPGTLVTTGGNPGQHMFHPAGQSAQHSIAAITPTNMQPIVWSFDFFDTFPLTNKRVTGGLRNTSNSQILEMGWFNSVSNPETSTTISGYAVRTVGVGGAPGNWVTFQGNPTEQGRMA